MRLLRFPAFDRKRLPAGLAAASAAVVATVAMGFGADRYLSRGLEFSWYASQGGERIEVHRSVEHRAEVPTRHRPVARYAQHWPFDRWGVPAHMPLLDAVARGRIVVPPGESWAVRVRAVDGARLVIDGRPAAPDRRLEAGEHALELHWRGRLHRSAQASLRWERADAARGWVPLPPSALRPPVEREGESRPWVVAITVLVGTWLAASLWCAVAAASASVRRRALHVTVAGVLVLVAAWLRLWDYDVIPEMHENHDELFATWNGWSLLVEGKTRGWSLWPERYGDSIERGSVDYFGAPGISLITPYFEHPPLFHVLIGAAALAGGAKHWLHGRLRDTRLVPIALSLLSLVLVLAIGRRLDPHGPATWLAGLLYAVLPLVALQGRVIKEDALLTFLVLLASWLYLRWRADEARLRWLVGAAVAMGLSVGAKVVGATGIAALVLLVAARRRWGAAALTAIIGALGIGALALYGALLDWDVFWTATTHQATVRPTHWNLFPRFFDSGSVNHNLIGRPWLLFLWLTYAMGVLRDAHREPLLVVVPVSYLVGLAISSGNWSFGWYWMPLLPFLCLGAGRALADAWSRPDALRGLLVVGLLASYGLNFLHTPDWAKDTAHRAELRRSVTLVTLGLWAPHLLAHVLPVRGLLRLARAALFVALVLFAAGSAWFVVQYEALYETHRNFDRDPFFDR